MKRAEPLAWSPSEAREAAREDIATFARSLDRKVWGDVEPSGLENMRRLMEFDRMFESAAVCHEATNYVGGRWAAVVAYVERFNKGETT